MRKPPNSKASRKVTSLSRCDYIKSMIFRILLWYTPFCYFLPIILIGLFELSTQVEEDWVSRGLLERNGISAESIIYSPIYWILCTIIFILSIYFFEFRKKNK